MRIDVVKADVLKNIKPGKEEEERVKKFANKLLLVSRSISGMDCVLVGSLGKFTWLRGDHDVDLFIMFPLETSREELEKRGLELGKKIASEMRGKWRIKYAEHPYVHAFIGGFDVDIVPCYRIANGESIKSAVDRSPLHLEYVLKTLKDGQQDEVRLLKQFCKGISVYGSDARHLGFSGYICELLVMKYGSFESVLASAANWRTPQVVSFGAVKGSFKQPLIIIDPTDASRNAAANVSGENLVKFIASARSFIRQSDKKYFYKQEPDRLSAPEIKLLQKRGTIFIALSLKKPDIIEDVLYPQLRKTLRRLETIFMQNGFSVMRCYETINENEIFLIFEIETASLPNIKKMVGPPLSSHTHTQEFLTKYKSPDYGPYVEDDRWVIEKKRESTTPENLLKALLHQDLTAIGIPDNIAKPMKKSVIVKDVWKLAKTKKTVSAFLREKYFSSLRV